jgi:hypothetical protein
LGVLTLTDFEDLDYLPPDVRPSFFSRRAREPSGEAPVRRIPSNLFLLLAALAGVISTGCQSGGVGDPCIPEDEYRASFSGYGVGEVNVESRSFQCETRLCLAANFQGRVSCPYGQADPAQPACYLPGTKVSDGKTVTVPVPKQLVLRQTSKAVYCSCRCGGADTNVNYCQCPSGYACEKLVDDIGLGSAQLAGSYCIKDGTKIKDVKNPGPECTPPNCGPANPYGL